MEGHVNTYGGMDKDTAYDSIKQSMYIDALDIRITTDKGESQGAFTNIKGNEFSFTIPSAGTFNGNPWSATNPEIIGYGTIRNVIVLFVADDSVVSGTTKGWIYKVTYDPADRTKTGGTPVLLYYSDRLNFKKEWPIEALGRYESNTIQRIYWTDYNNLFRTINIENPDLATFAVENVDIFPNIDFNLPLLKAVVGGGSLKTGQYQIAYRLITSDGKETLISPPSNMIPIYTKSITDNYVEILGDALPAVNSGKSMTLEVNVPNFADYEKIEFFSLYYTNPTATPVASSIEIQTLSSSTATLVYTGAEESLFDIELFTFTSKNFAFKTFKTVTQKDNYLVGANIKSSTIDVQDLLDGGSFSALTRRYDSGGGTPFTPGSPTNDLNNAFNVDFNKDEHWEPTWHTGSQYKYQSDLTTLGGEGPNISYKFHLEPMSVDGDTQAKFHNQGLFYQTFDSHNLNDGYGTYTNLGFADNTSPFISGLLRGYKRGETYRFGIIFYTLKGEATYVEYIGDIKFPDISEPDGANNASQTPYWPLSTYGSAPGFSLPTNLTIGFNLGIEFSLDFTSCPNLLNNITGFQIVRVPRTNTDKRRLCQGTLRTYYYTETGNVTPPFPFDFRINSSTNVVHLFNAGRAGTNNKRIDEDTLQYFSDGQDPNNTFLYGTPAPGWSGATTYIRSQHMAFFSPEISYQYDGIPEIASSTGNNPALLITGRYTAVTNGVDYEGDGLATPASTTNTAIGPGQTNTWDYGFKFKRVNPVTFNSIENIKRFANSSFFNMKDSTNVTIDSKTAAWGSAANPLVFPAMGTPSYARNYFAWQPDSANNLNNPGTTGAFSPIIGRGGTNISGLLSRYTSNPLGGALTGSSPADYFIINGNTTYPTSINVLDETGAAANTVESVAIADLVIPRIEAYGGSTQNALESNNFIIASPLIRTTFGTNTYAPKVFGGDIFINMASIQISMAEFNGELYQNNRYEDVNVRTDLMVTESVINLDLHHGANTSTGVEFTINSDEKPYFRQEDNNSSSTYGQLIAGKTTYDMYAYNGVFSKVNREVTFFIKPNNLTDLSTTNDTRAFLSDVKVNGEDIDSWTKFAINDFYDVDDHGPINKIINFKDNVYFLQDQATGVYAINREAVTTTDDGVPTELGISQGWGKHQYFSKENGSIHQWAVAVTDRGVYFFDAIHRKIFQLGQAKTGLQNVPLSELKGIHSYLQELGEDVFLRKEDGGDNPILYKGPHIGVDEINDEILFTFLSITDREDLKTIVFDEVAGQFSSRMSATPKIWINNGDTLISPNPDDSGSNFTDDVYIHNIGNWGEFYGTQTGCEITLVINPKADINKVLRFLEFNSIVRNDDKVIDRTQTITGFKITTETQASDSIYETTPDSLTRIKRRFDKWRIKLPRDVNSTSQKGRFRSTHFLLTLYFDNTYNKELIMNRLVSYYDPQIF